MFDVGGKLGNERELVLLNRRQFAVALIGVGQKFVAGIDSAVLRFENVMKALNCFIYRQKFPVVCRRTRRGEGRGFIGRTGRRRGSFLC